MVMRGISNAVPSTQIHEIQQAILLSLPWWFFMMTDEVFHSLQHD